MTTIAIGIGLWWRSILPPGPGAGDGMLLENGVDFVLLEDGSFVLLE